MKLQATVTLTLQAKTHAAAGAVLDELLDGARDRDDVAVGRVEVVTPPSDGVVSLPPVRSAEGARTSPSRGVVTA